VEQVAVLAEMGLKTRGGSDVLDPELLGHAMLALGEMAGRLVLVDPVRYSPERVVGFVSAFAHLLPK